MSGTDEPMQPDARRMPAPAASDGVRVPSSDTDFDAPPEAELTFGSELYLDTLHRMHRHLQPEIYLETGVGHGFSLALAASRIAIGIDPRPKLAVPLPDRAHVAITTSDAFFEQEAERRLDGPIDFGFIDGMHLFEFALRDFINIERRAGRCSLIVFDDAFPSHPLQAERERRSRVWTGDVWKILPCLRKYRPDLALIALDTQLAGLLLVADLDPASDVLAAHYDAIVDEFTGANAPAVPASVLSRAGALAPNDERIAVLMDALRCARSDGSRRTLELALASLSSE